MPPELLVLNQVITRHDGGLARIWERGPLTLAHGDCHLGNIYLRADHSVGLLDWQVVHRVIGLRDVACFLADSVPTPIRRAYEADLIRRYLERLRGADIDSAPDFDHASSHYCMFTVDAFNAAAVTTAAGKLQTTENAEAPFLRVCATLEDLDTLGLIRQVLSNDVSTRCSRANYPNHTESFHVHTQV